MAIELNVIATQEGGGCSCCATPAAATRHSVEENATAEQTVTTTYIVSGMTCGHCVASVTEEVSTLDGVTGVEVDLASGKVTVTSAALLAEADVRAAVDEAGYQLVG